MFDRAALGAALQAHGRAVRVVITEVKGSTPRDVGAAMLVWADANKGGGQSGTIGGGALEYAAAARARAALSPSALLTGTRSVMRSFSKRASSSEAAPLGSFRPSAS